ncbi:MAG: hypothetical protein NZV61_01965 [Candidatus Bipolaricaulota bacterium]|nr:hypothetical protein [Candidatus Bipolaricaulota bacterium]
MTRAKVALSLVLIMLLGSQWLAPSHSVATARPAADSAHTAHATHAPNHSAPAQPHHHCCEQESTPSSHGDLCCVSCPALPSISADVGSYTPYLFLTVVEPHKQSFVFLPPLWHPPTL